MLAQTDVYMDAIAHIPPKGKLQLRDVDWEEYEEILRQMEAKPGYRVSYNKGRLIVMSPRPDHERPKDFIFRLAAILADELGVDLETAGSTTFRRRAKAKGAEPDTCFYVQSAARVITWTGGKAETFPIPDVVVEIDTTNESLYKLEIYAGLGVPELWRWEGRAARFYQLADGRYQEIAHSLAFPLLTPEVLADFIQRSQLEGHTATLRAFRAWVREQNAA